MGADVWRRERVRRVMVMMMEDVMKSTDIYTRG